MSLHHLSIRKRIAQALEPYPANNRWKRLLDKAIFAVGVVGPLMSIPQILLIYSTHDASGIAPFTWLSWAGLNIPWIVYGLVHRELPIVMTYCLWFVCNTLIFIGALVY